MADGKKGRGEAHTPTVSAGGAAPPTTPVDPRPLAEALAAELDAAEGHQPGLFEDEAPELPIDLPIRSTRSRLASPRGRGRPLGAGNKRSELMRDTLLKLGFQHPMVVLAGVASASPEEVAAELAGGEREWLSCGAETKRALLDQALRHITGAATALLPYFESRRPAEVHVQEDRRALFLVGQIDAAAGPGAALSLGGGNGKVFDIQGLSGGQDVRGDDAPSRDDD